MKYGSNRGVGRVIALARSASKGGWADHTAENSDAPSNLITPSESQDPIAEAQPLKRS